jgi:hypothetical protein
MWIRRKLESQVLTIEGLRKILKSDFFDPHSGNRIRFVKRHRHHKVECIIFPSREISGKSHSPEHKSSSGLFKRELVLDYESVDHNGFIRYFDPSRETSGLSDDEITFLVPNQARSSSSSSSGGESSASSATPSYVSSYGRTKVTILQMTTDSKTPPIYIVVVC